MYHRDMFKLVERRFADYFKGQAETGMGYWIATAFLKDGRAFKQVVIDSGYVTKVRGHFGVPFVRSRSRSLCRDARQVEVEGGMTGT